MRQILREEFGMNPREAIRRGRVERGYSDAGAGGVCVEVWGVIGCDMVANCIGCGIPSAAS
jgi:hypothetical protein